MRCRKSSPKREIYSNTILPQETRKTSNRQPNFTPKTTGKRRTKNPKVSRRKEIIEIRAEINEKEVKETTERLIKLKPGSLINKIDKPLARLQGKKGEESNQQN